MRSIGRRARTYVAAISLISAPVACAHHVDSSATEPPEDATTSDTGTPDASTNPCSADNLCKTDLPIDEFLQLTSVRGSGASDVWAVGARGTVLHYNGSAWEAAKQEISDGGSAYTLLGVWLERPDDVWVVEGGAIHHSTGWKGPHATDWSSSDVSGFAPVAALDGKGGTIWITGSNPNDSFVREYGAWVDGGPGDYQDFTVPNTRASITVTTSRTDEIWISGYRPGSNVTFYDQVGCAFRGHRTSDDAGLADDAAPTWAFDDYEVETTLPLNGAWGDESGAWFVGNGGTLRHIARAAVPTKQFEVVASPVTTDLHAAFGFGADDVWAVGDEATVLHWDGAVWSKVSTPYDGVVNKPRFLSLWGSSPTDVWIVGTGTMLHFQGSRR